NIDIKHEASIVPLVEVLNHAGAHDRVCVASFSGKRLDRFRNLTDGGVCTATSPSEIARIRLAGIGLGGARLAAACTQVPARQGPVVVVTRQFVDSAHRRNLPVHVWTIDDAMRWSACSASAWTGS